jgi:hypothetical protein
MTMDIFLNSEPFEGYMDARIAELASLPRSKRLDAIVEDMRCAMDAALLQHSSSSPAEPLYIIDIIPSRDGIGAMPIAWCEGPYALADTTSAIRNVTRMLEDEAIRYFSEMVRP